MTNLYKSVNNKNMKNTKSIFHLHVPCTEDEAEVIKKYCRENGIILGQLTRILLLREIKTKSVLLQDYEVPPNEECKKKDRT